jgi:hypothetical protein
MHQSFEGKVALVTGGSRGIGLVPLGLGCRAHWDHNDGKSSFSVGWSKRASPKICCHPKNRLDSGTDSGVYAQRRR